MNKTHSLIDEGSFIVLVELRFPLSSLDFFASVISVDITVLIGVVDVIAELWEVAHALKTRFA